MQIETLEYTPKFRELLRGMLNTTVAQTLLSKSSEQYSAVKYDAVNYLDFDGENITAIPHRALLRAESKEAAEKYRATFRIGRLFGQLFDWDKFCESFPGFCKDAELERVSTEFGKVVNARKLECKIVSGEDIRFWYNSRNYAPGSGSLHCSCMRYSHCADYFDIYTENPEQIGMLIATNSENALMGRAIVWTPGNGKRYLDRIYSCSTDAVSEYAVTEIMRSWANDNGITESASACPPVQLSNWHFDEYPYCDTMSSLNTSTGKIARFGGDLELTDTDGNPNRVDDEFYCEGCNSYYDEDDAYYIDGIGEYRCRDCSASCDNCSDRFCESDVSYVDGFGDYCDSCREDKFVVDGDGDEIAIDDAATCAGCDETYHVDRIETTIDGKSICADCASCDVVELADGAGRILADDVDDCEEIVTCADCAEFAHVDFAVEVDGETLCAGCNRVRVFPFPCVDCAGRGNALGGCRCTRHLDSFPARCLACCGTRFDSYPCHCAVVVMERYSRPLDLRDLDFRYDAATMAPTARFSRGRPVSLVIRRRVEIRRNFYNRAIYRMTQTGYFDVEITTGETSTIKTWMGEAYICSLLNAVVAENRLCLGCFYVHSTAKDTRDCEAMHRAVKTAPTYYISKRDRFEIALHVSRIGASPFAGEVTR